MLEVRDKFAKNNLLFNLSGKGTNCSSTRFPYQRCLFLTQLSESPITISSSISHILPKFFFLGAGSLVATSDKSDSRDSGRQRLRCWQPYDLAHSSAQLFTIGAKTFCISVGVKASAIFERDLTACSRTTVSSVEQSVSKSGRSESLFSSSVEIFPNSSAIANNTSSSSFLIKSTYIVFIANFTIKKWY